MELMLENDATVKDMEAAAIAWVCEKLDVPFMALKVITDIVDGDRPSHEEFMENLGHAAHALHEALPKTIQFIAGKKISDL
jgi:5'-methylthioadenosine nucleosidase